MAYTFSEYAQFVRDHVGAGYVTGFVVTGVGSLNLDQTANGTGGLSGQSVLIRPKSRMIMASRVTDGLVYMSDGSIFNPWGLSGERPPVAFPQYTQTFIYHGHPPITMQYYSQFLGYVGYTGQMAISYGRINDTTFSTKYCPAVLQTVSAAAERVLNSSVTTTKTIMEFTATWQQTGAFTP